MIKNNYRILLFSLLFCQFVTAQTAPVANNDSYSTETNTPLNISVPGLLGNDTDADGDALSVTEFSVNGDSYTVGQTATFPQGTITIRTDGSFSFNLAASCNRDIPRIIYTISDGTFTDFANLSISIINSFPPNAEDDCDTVEINTDLIVTASEGLLSNDTDQDNNFLCVINFSVGGNTVNAGDTITLLQGSITINADGSFTFSPAADYIGDIPTIAYCISDGTFTRCANLLLTVEPITDLIEISALGSINQGYTIDGEYKIRYNISLRNTSTARDYHPTSLINNIDLTNDLDAIYGVGCVIEVDEVRISTTEIPNCVDGFYPREFDNSSVNPNFLNATSTSIFNDDAINNATLYPRQSINIQLCVTVEPFCNGRPNPTPSGSNINFNSVFDVTATTTKNTTIINHNDTANLLLTDFHTTEAVVAAGLYLEEPSPPENTDGTYDFINTVIITNESTVNATNNVNYNMGLGDFLDNGIVFRELKVTQVFDPGFTGPTVTVNTSYDGDGNTQLLMPNNSLGPGETIILEIFYLIEPFSSEIANDFTQMNLSQTQGALDGFNEATATNRRQYSFVTWSDGLGNHLDRYYPTGSPTEAVSSRLQCSGTTLSMTFLFPSSSTTNKTIIDPIDTIPEGILEHEEITFQITITNTSPLVQLENLQLQDDLDSMCSGNIIPMPFYKIEPEIQNSTATTDPILNPNYNGITDINLFDGTSGLLEPDQSITIQFTVLFYEDCISSNRVTFSAKNPLNTTVTSSGSVPVNAFTDTDNDGITNFNDLDDDNDTIPDIEEYNGLDPLNRLNPLDDDDNDFIPNYRDTDYGTDANNDGIIDIFDFDNDGVPNHFDLDSDNDGIFDIVEAGNSRADTNRNGRTNNTVGANGLDNTVENNDTFSASITYTIPNSDDNNGNPNFIDIDADGDGIVDNIEAQTTISYNPPNGAVTISGIDTTYPNGVIPVDTDNDNIPDYIDENSDDDYRPDTIEGWDFNNDGIAETIASTIDADNDGLDDAYDNNDNLINPTNGQVPIDFPNVDIPITVERDWREIIDIFVIIDNVSADEGSNLEFTISLVTRNDNSILVQSTTPIDISFSITDPIPISVTDASFYDYILQIPPNLTILPFTSTGTFNVFSVDDAIDELDELFTLDGVITSNNTINTEIAGIGTILDNETVPSISMNDSRAIEGNDLEHTIILSHPSSRPIQVEVNTEDITAVNPYDYTFDNNNPIILTIDGTIDPNNANTEVSFPISTQDDTIDEPDEETLSVVGTITSGDVGDQDLAKTGTIIDNDDPPSIEMNDSSAIEGDDLVHTITLSHPSSTPILINIDVSDGTATSPDDYTFNPNPASLEIEATTDPANPNLQVSFPIPTRTDNINELDEELNVIGTVTSGNVGTQDLTKTGTIIDNNLDPMVVIDDVTVVEGNTLVFTITLLDENLELVQNSFPINLDLESVDGTATAGQDFESVLTNVSIPALTSSITQSVQTIDDRLNEETETMQLQVTIRSTEVTNSSSMIFGTGTIKDNDVPNLFSPNGDGRSDVFRIAGIEDFPNFKLIIIDRWGSEVYNYSNNGNINPTWWDGTHKGKPVIEGVYFYTLDFNDGSTPPQTNFIQLIR